MEHTVKPDRSHFAAFLDLRGKHAVVVGGGEIGEGKVEALLRAGARVTVVSPDLHERLAQWAAQGTIAHRARRFSAADLGGAAIAIAATNDHAVNAAVAGAARALAIPVNVVDDLSLSTFITPAVVDRGPIQIAVSTGGASPVIAGHIAALVASAVPPGYGRLAMLAREYRDAVKRRFARIADRRRFWKRVVDGPIAELMLEGCDVQARAMLEHELQISPNAVKGSDSMPAYAFGKTVKTSYEETLKLATEALAKEGFGVLTEIDVQATLKKKLGKDMPPYKILGACNPQFAHRAIEAEPQIGALLPCNVVVRVNADGETVVEIMDPRAVLKLVDRAEIEPIAAEVRERLERVLASLQ